MCGTSLVILLSLAVTQSSLPAADSLLARADSAQCLVQSLAGTISREVSALDEPTVKMLGKFYWADPNYRLDFSDPEPMTVLFDGHRLKVIRPEKHETTTRDLEHPAGLGHSPASPWFPSIKGLLDVYGFRLKGQGPIEGHDVWVLEGAAKDTARHPSEVMLWLDKVTDQPLRMETYDGGEFPTSIFLVDSAATIDSLRVPVRFRNWLGLETGTLEIATDLSGVRLNPVLHDSLFGDELQPAREPDEE